MIDAMGLLPDQNLKPHEGTYKKISFYTPPDIVQKESQNAILSNLQLTWTGCYTKAYGHVVTDRTVQDYIIIYCVDGLGWLILDDKRWKIKKGDVFVCPPDMPHSYGADDKSPWTKYYIHFRGKCAPAYMEMLGLTKESPVMHIGDHTNILSWFQDIFNLLKTGYTQSNLLCATAYLGHILCYINGLSTQQSLLKDEDMNADKVIAYMLDNVNGNVSLEDMAGFANLSKYHFVRVFKEKTGYTPVDYYIRLKIQKACELLGSSTANISSISTMLGFNSPYYFSIAFKRIIGKSPKAYREML